jgi:predicted GNAT family N-acyltransferase
VSILLLDASHDRTRFACEEESLTNYLKTQVSQDIKRRVSICFVKTDAGNRVIGYYTLASESLGRDTIPEVYRNQVPTSYNAPVILLGRLARDISLKGTGLGEELLLDALERAYTLSAVSIGAMAVVVDPINAKATQFYEKYGFIKLPDSGRMFLPMKVIQKLFTT